MLLSGQNILVEYGIQTVLDIEKLEIWEGDRIGLVGKNGAGKSTLFQVLCGEKKPDAGVIRRNGSLAYIPQDQEAHGEADGMYVSRMRLQNSAVKSGGERTRMAIAAAFSQHAPLLLADEPTTNLDREGIEQLEKMLCGYRGAVVLISHDRELLDRVCTQIWELEDGRLHIFPGNYTQWYEERERTLSRQQFEYEQYQREKGRLEQERRAVLQQAKSMGKPPKRMSNSEWMLYKNTATVQQKHVQSRAKAMESRIGHLEKKEKPRELPHVSMKMGEQGRIKGKNAARAENLTVSYGDHTVLCGAECQIAAGKKTFLTGENGSGKTTLLNCFASGRDHDGIYINSDAVIGYFSQQQETLDFNKTVLENVRSTAVSPEHICRAVLMNLCMRREDLDKKISVLSGGERVKTALAKLLVSGANFLILDEPTNHMDIYTMEGLERLLKDYDGTLLAVSHDRKFVSSLADVIYRVEDGRIFRNEEF